MCVAEAGAARDLLSACTRTKTGTRSPASLLRRNYFTIPLLRNDCGVIRKMQIVVALTIEVNPALSRRALCRTDRYREHG